ncbi:MAG: energy transducer TonB [Candidatus Latescibacterota bacterium]
MSATFRDKEHSYRKRLLIVIPFAVLVVVILFITSDMVPPTILDKTFGWKGALQVLPDITIISGNDPFESFSRERELRTMSSIHLDLIDETGEGETGQKDNIYRDEPEIPIPPEEGLDVVRMYEAHTSVPYSEDYVILNMEQPEYPVRELLDGIEGDVTVELLVSENGKVEKAWVLSAIGPRSFEKSTLNAVEKFLFQPPMENGLPTSMWIRFLIKFRIYR